MAGTSETSAESKAMTRDTLLQVKEALANLTEAAHVVMKWLEGEFSDTDFDHDTKLAEAHAGLFVASHTADQSIAKLNTLLEAQPAVDEDGLRKALIGHFSDNTPDEYAAADSVMAIVRPFIRQPVDLAVGARAIGEPHNEKEFLHED